MNINTLHAKKINLGRFFPQSLKRPLRRHKYPLSGASRPKKGIKPPQVRKQGIETPPLREKQKMFTKTTPSAP